MTIFQKITFTLLFSLFTLSSYGQEMLAGASGIYNFQTESIGFGIRGELAYDRFSIVPQFNYFPSFNKIHEYYFGVSGHYNLINASSWKFYGIANLGYNRWINNEDAPDGNGKKSNVAFELGGGVATNGILNPFIEYRYNVKWRETMLHVGLMYYFGGGSSFICQTYQ